MGFIQGIIGRVEAILGAIDIAAKKDIQIVLDEMKLAEAEAQQRITELIATARGDIAGALAAATPEVEKAVKDLAAKLEADIMAVLHHGRAAA